MQIRNENVCKKNGQEGQRLEQVNEQVDVAYITNEINLLSKIVHHRNLLKNYRKTINELRNLHTCVMIDMDFSEKLKVTTKNEAQSQHWNQRSIIVHSGIMREQGVKSYHAYMSEDCFQDQVFVNVVLDRMMEESNVDEVEKIIIESDNCTSQYKSSEHFAG